jgi:hypothetical protein
MKLFILRKRQLSKQSSIFLENGRSVVRTEKPLLSEKECEGFHSNDQRNERKGNGIFIAFCRLTQKLKNLGNAVRRFETLIQSDVSFRFSVNWLHFESKCSAHKM